MTTNIATTKEQSARLLQCGVSAESADMYYQVPITLSQKQRGEDILLLKRPNKTLYNIDTPAWSLSALLSLLPKEICDENDDSFYFSLAKELPLTNEYCATYLPCWDKGDALVRKRDNDPIEACVQLIEWLTANNYKLNEL